MDNRLQTALTLAQERRARPGVLRTQIRGPQGLVTAADHAIAALLGKRIPGFELGVAIPGEDVGQGGMSVRLWPERLFVAIA